VLTVAGFIAARLLMEEDARRDSEHRAEVAAAQIHGRVADAASLTKSLRQFMLDSGGTGVTSDQFTSNALRWLNPAGFPAAAWVERVPPSRRAAYERRLGQPIVTADALRSVVPPGSRTSYLPTTLVSGFPPMSVPGTDLSREAGMATALTRATRVEGVAATSVAPRGPRTGGLFVVAQAPNLISETLRPGYVVVFVPDVTLRRAATDAPTVRITSAAGSSEPGDTAGSSFTEAGQRFNVLVPLEPVAGAAAAVPWIVVAAGLVLAGLAAALGVSSAKRARAQNELDRIFNLSPDLIAVADFDGRFTRVNPAVEQVLGYTQEEFVGRPYLDVVHPDDRDTTAAEAAAIGEGKRTLSFENRYLRKDGSPRVLEWTSTPVVEDGAMYGMARDVTERRRAEAEVERLAEEQAALRRVATLVAQDVPSSELFLAVAREVGTLLDADFSGMIRYDDDATVSTVATWAAVGEHPPVPDHFRTEAGDPSTMIAETREPARVDDWTVVPGRIAEVVREDLGVRSSVGSPILVEGRLWGALAVHSKQRAPLPPDTESRVAQFTDLVATAIANAEARAEVERLAEEQAALRRVATLVAEGVQPVEVFSAVSKEVGRLLGSDLTAVSRFQPDGSAYVVVGLSKPIEGVEIGSRFELDDSMAATQVYRTGRSARVDGVDWAAVTAPIGAVARRLGSVSTICSPIVVEGRLWGGISVTDNQPLPRHAEQRLEQFTGLVATAIANAESREALGRLADEQAALRRVATLVAEGAPPTAVFDAVAAEMEQLLGADRVSLSRYEPGAKITVLAHRGSAAELVPSGSRLSHEGDNVQELVRRTERPARMEDFEEAHGPIAEAQRTMGARVVVGAPVVIDGRVWGVIGASWVGEEPPPGDTEERMVQFAGLLETAIANADSRDQLDASRARLVTAADEARRRLVRDLHDGAQQRLVHTIVTLKLAKRALGTHDGEAGQLVGDALEQAERSNRELRELAHGVLPAVLERGGLRAGVDAFVGRLDLPVRLDVPAQRFPAEIEASAYFIAAEALTNIVKHAQAEHAEVSVSVQNGALHVQVRDDGIGGADPAGHGLVGLGDRATALGGRLHIESPPGGGTRLAATLPLPAG
jgi:PAS domain S-box-containing protein